MMKYIVKYCRELIFLVFSVCSDHFLPFLGLHTLMNFLPAFLYGCTAPQAMPPPETETVTKVSMEAVSGDMEEMDIFVFKDDRLQRLDCYQKVTAPASWNNEIVSGYGERIIAVFANSGKDVMDWAGISSLSYLSRQTVSLEEESLKHPFMSGTVKIAAGKESRYNTLDIRPLLSIVELRSICCDFRGRPYAGEPLEDVRVYLTNVNAECRVLEESDILPSRILNAGRLREEDISSLKAPDLIVREIGQSIGTKPVYPGIQLICYPNNSATESPGTPFTRLVIEGKVQGETFYWPLNINKDDGGYGIGRNEKYIFDITITRKGTKDPDLPVSTEDIDIILNIGKWDEKEDCEVLF